MCSKLTLQVIDGAPLFHASLVMRYLMNPLLCLQEGCPFIVCMTYAFQTTEKLCFILDLMNGGDLHYHLSQHGLFNEKQVRFYASEIVLGLEHMHSRNIVYRDLKVRYASNYNYNTILYSIVYYNAIQVLPLLFVSHLAKR